MNTEFLIRTFLSNTQSSSFQRGNVYAENATAGEKRAFQDDFRRRLRALAEPYAQRVPDDVHVRTIQEFAEQLSQSHPSALANARLRIGTAQKAVNLYLKFLWSINVIPEPPHCPVDRIVLTALGDRMNWTELDDIQAYRDVIASIRQQARGSSPAQWEYDLWNRMAQQGTGGAA